MVSAVLLVHQELKANKEIKVCPAFLEKRETEESKATRVKVDNLVTMANKVKTDLLVCPAYLARWDLVVSPDSEDFPVFQDHQESLEVKVQLALKETRVLPEVRELQVKLDQTAQSVHLDLRVF